MLVWGAKIFRNHPNVHKFAHASCWQTMMIHQSQKNNFSVQVAFHVKSLRARASFKLHFISLFCLALLHYKLCWRVDGFIENEIRRSKEQRTSSGHATPQLLGTRGRIFRLPMWTVFGCQVHAVHQIFSANTTNLHLLDPWNLRYTLAAS